MDTYSFIKRYRWWLIVLPIAVSVLMLLPLTKAKINPNLMDYLPDDIESKMNIDRLDSIFGKYEPLLLVVQTDDILNESTLRRISDLNEAFKEMPEVDDVMSIFETKNIRGEDGMMLVDPAIREFPTTEEEKELLRNELIDNQLAYKIFISDDFKNSLIIINPKIGVTDEELIKSLKIAINQHPGDEIIYMNGLPFLRSEIQAKGIRDFAILLPLGLIVMLIFLYISFKERRGVLLPFSVVLMSIVIAIGLMPLFGYDLSLIAVLVPIMMIAIANNYGIHLVARYQELNSLNPTMSMEGIVYESIKQLKSPIILTGLTTIFGVMGLIVQVLLPAKQMGIVNSIAIAFALIISLLFIPAVMIGMKKGAPQKSYTSDKNMLIDRVLGWAGRISTKNPRQVIYFFVSFLILAGLGISYLQVSINMERMMPSSHPLRKSTDIVNDHFGGTKNISILFEGDIMDPEVLKTMDRFEAELELLPNVGGVTSLASVIRIISRSLNDSTDELYDRIPDERETIAQYIEFYSMSGDPDDFEKLVDFDYTKAILTVQFNAKDMRQLKQTEMQIQKLVDSSPYCTIKAGQCLVEKELAQSIARGQVYSLIFAMLAIVILLWIIFRSLPAGLLGAIPLGVTLISNFGLMGWFGLELDIGNSLLSSIAIGIGVDYTIHLFWRLKYELSLGKEYTDAIRNTLKTTGRGIAINAVSVMIGFAVLFLSGLVILKTFAFLIIFSLLLCLLCALILVPAICMVARPKFLEMNGKLQYGFANAATVKEPIHYEKQVIEKEYETQTQEN